MEGKVAQREKANSYTQTVLQIVFGLKDYDHQVWFLTTKGVLAKDVEARGIPGREFYFWGGLDLFSLIKDDDS